MFVTTGNEDEEQVLREIPDGAKNESSKADKPVSFKSSFRSH